MVSITDFFSGLTMNNPTNASNPPATNMVKENETCDCGNSTPKLAMVKLVALEIKGDAMVTIPETNNTQPTTLTISIINNRLSKINVDIMDIFTDGSGETGKYAYVIPEKKIVKIFQKRGLTNNEAEYFGVIEALKQNKDRNVRIHSDSQLIVNQLNKNYKIKEPRLKVLAEQVWKLCEGRNIKFKWLSREKNFAGKILG